VNLIQQIGAYAGFAAIIGLAVLSALYFSQARDLRRLREWAGRAPERGGATARAQPQARPAATTQNAPQPAAPASTGTAPANAPAAATPAPAAQATAPAAKASPEPAPAVPAAAGAQPAVSALRGGTSPAATQPGARPGVRPPSPPQAPSQPPRTVAGPAGGGNSSPMRRPGPVASVNGTRRERSSLPYVALAVVGALIVIGAGAFAFGLIGERGDPGAQRVPASERADAPGGGSGAPSTVTFSVLNGTNVEGLAKQVADELEAEGYRRGNVTNAGEQRTDSVVLYASGARSNALAVGRKLGIRQVEPVDSRSQGLAGDATVVVVVGADQTQ
jgi:hypothetical protein